MTTEFYIKLLAIIVGVVLAIVFIASIAKAEIPCGFATIEKICQEKGEIVNEVLLVEVTTPDTLLEGNKDGTVRLIAGVGPDGTGCMITILTSENDPLIAVAVMSIPDGTFKVINFMTQEVDACSKETACEFADTWLRLYIEATSKTQV